MSDERMQSLLDRWYQDRETPPPKVQTGVAVVMADVPRTRQRGRWWPLPTFERPMSTFPTRGSAPAPIPATNGHPPARGFTMFSALKFIAASVIVALFGGFLMVGVLTTQPSEDQFSAAVSPSPTIEATGEPSEPTEAESTSVRSDILPGVELTVEEVEPGVFKVLDDGVRTRFEGDIIAGHDGSILLVHRGDGEQGSFARLGSKRSRRLPEEALQVVATPDGTVWVVSARPKNRYLIHSLAGGTWTRRARTSSDGPAQLTVAPDGTVWFANVNSDEKDVGRLVIKRMGADGWQRVGEAPLGGELRPVDGGNLVVTEDGEPWWVPYHVGQSFDFGDDGSWHVVEGGSLSRLHTWTRRGGGSEWHEVTIYAPVYMPGMLGVELGTDGTVWLAGVSPLMVDAMPVRTGDSPFAAPAEQFVMRYDGTGWQRWGPDDGVPSLAWSRPRLEQGPDGGLWVSAQPDPWFMPADAADRPFGGIARFDGSNWQYFLSGHDVSDWDIAPDGSVWLRADGGLYVITPEAVAASD